MTAETAVLLLLNVCQRGVVLLLTVIGKTDKSQKRVVALFYCLCLMFGVLSACVPATKAYLRPGVDLRQITKVAVMPLENLTNDRFAGKKIQHLMITELLRSGQVDVIEPGEVFKVLRSAAIPYVSALDIENIKFIGQQLRVSAVVVGSVHAFGVTRGVTVSYPEVTIHCMVVETTSGAIIASTQYTSGGASFWSRHFKAEGPTLDETAEDAATAIVRSLFLQ